MLDIGPILDGWDYVPEDVTVRIIRGEDQKEKIQMRLDLGLLQMEYDGRPDGRRPHGFDSLLEYHEYELEKHVADNQSGEEFRLSPEDCAGLKSEAMQYYYRYLSLFHLQRYDAVERDTARNLRVFDFLRKYAQEEEDRYALEQYRPYVVMMNTRAGAYRLLAEKKGMDALEKTHDGIEKIRRFFAGLKRPDLAGKSGEMALLQQLSLEIEAHLKEDPLVQLREKMKEAVAREDFETAAFIRDEIRRLQGEEK